MCGIIHVKRVDSLNANKSVLKRYKNQKSRGSQGFGFIAIKDGYVLGEYRAEDEKDISKQLEDIKCDEILFHHRYPTSTPNFKEATHPILVDNKMLDYKYYVVHNGIISNADDLYDQYKALGFVFNTEIKKQYVTKNNTYSEIMFNDSESFAIDLALFLESKTDKIESIGSIAFVCLQVDKKTNKLVKIFYGRNSGNPLKLENNKNIFGLSSESGESIKEDILFCVENDKITQADCKIGKVKSYYESFYNSNNYVGSNTYNYDYLDDIETTHKAKDYKNIFNFDNEENDFDYLDEEELTLEQLEVIDELDTEIQEFSRINDFDKVEELEEYRKTLLEYFEEENGKKNNSIGYLNDF